MIKIICVLLLLVANPVFALPLDQQQSIETLVKQGLKLRGGIVIVKDISQNKTYLFGNKTLYQQKVNPGSIIKLAFAYNFLKKSPEKVMQRHYRCDGVASIDGKKRYCWTHQGHGAMDFISAIVHSCNLYFASLQMDHGAWLSGLAEQKLSITVQPGYDPVALHYGDDEHLSVKFTDLLNWLTYLATKINDPELQPLFKAMRQAVLLGTASKANSPNVEILGKTGTSPTKGVYRTDGFFVGMAPAHQPIYIIIVMVKDNNGFDVPANLGGKILGKLLGEIT